MFVYELYWAPLMMTDDHFTFDPFDLGCDYNPVQYLR